MMSTAGSRVDFPGDFSGDERLIRLLEVHSMNLMGGDALPREIGSCTMSHDQLPLIHGKLTWQLYKWP